MKTKIREIIAITMIIIMLLATSSQAAVQIWLCKNNSGNDIRSNGTVYKFDNDKNGVIRNIQDYKIDNNHSYFCLMGGQQLQDVYGYNYGTYNNKTEFKDGNFSGLKSEYSAKGFQWLIKNMYTNPGNNDQNSVNYMLENLNKVIETYADNGYKDCKVIQGTTKIVDTEFIEVIEQLLVWKLVKNNNSAYTHEDMITSENDIAKIKFFNNGTVGYAESGNKIGYAVYSALLNGVKDEGKKYSIDESNNEYQFKLTKSSTTNIEPVQGEENSYVIGPFTLTCNATDKIQNITAKLNIDTTSIQYVTSKTGGTVLGTNPKNVLNKTFYIKFKTSKDLSTNSKVTYTCEADFNYRISSMDCNLYTENNKQPILEVNKILQKDHKTTSATIYKKDLDLALTKKISNVFRYNGEKYIKVWNGEEEDRLLSIDTSTIDNIGDATYKMNKRPVSVQVGDVVEYTINVYNEGNKKAFVEEITDYLPSGLELLKTDKIDDSDDIPTAEWNIHNKAARTILSYDNNKNIIKINKNKDLEPYNGEENFKEESIYEIKFECIVTDEAKIGNILTNVAEITKYGGYNGTSKVYANKKGVDIDSEQNNVFNGSASNVTSKETYDSNLERIKEIIDKLSGMSIDNIDKNGMGLQDDDDFEQIKIGTFDMALRKFITNVSRDGEDIKIEQSREPQINIYSAIQYLRNKTGAYYHTKDPISVEIGDLVTYTIRIYNEGYQDGYAKKITDYLPEGLKYVSSTVDGKDYKWDVVEGTNGKVIETRYLQDTLIKCANGEKGFANIVALNGKEIPEEKKFWKDVKVVCEVTKVGTAPQLTNVAEITLYGYNQVQNKQNGVFVSYNYIEAKKGEGDADIDSYQDNVFSGENVKNTEEYNLYQQEAKKNYLSSHGVLAYKGIEDDDDFENIVVDQSGNYEFILNKTDENGTLIDGSRFTIGRDGETIVNGEIVNKTKTLPQSNVSINKLYTYAIKEDDSADGYINILGDNIIHVGVILNSSLDLELSTITTGSDLKQKYVQKYGYYITDKDSNVIEDTKTDLYGKITVKPSNDTDIPKINVTIPNPKEEKLEGSFDLELIKYIKGTTDPLAGAGFKISIKDETGKELINDTSKVYITGNDGKLIDKIQNILIESENKEYTVTVTETRNTSWI